ncbi:hypothetical protein C8J56DRAFT_930999 [Mycena floridula]|nr:hypothetical protein C8J56DRAFT_930999 [Mycena floridula]
MASRRTHKKRISALRLSSDTTSTLPEYIASGGWQRDQPWPNSRPSADSNREPEDSPPGYPDSAEEADEDTDSDLPVSPIRSNPVSPNFIAYRRRRRRPNNLNHSRGNSYSLSDPYLDSLLERSVHALEMSNALLSQSSSAGPSAPLDTIYSSTEDLLISGSARSRSSRGRVRARDEGRERERDAWADDLEEISRAVEGLFEPHSRVSSQGSISSSLPTTATSALHKHHRRRPSLDRLASEPSEDRPHLRFENQDRRGLIAPPPRALTQYVASTSDMDTIQLPSTLGLRSAGTLHRSSIPPTPISCSTPNLHAALSEAMVTEQHDPGTRAYAMLSSFVRRGSTRSSSTTRPSTANTIRASSVDARPPTLIEEASSSSSSDGVTAKQTISALRKILDEQPPPPPHPSTLIHKRPPPSLLTAPSPPEASTSTATASVSRLFRKPTHTATKGVLKAPTPVNSIPPTPTASNGAISAMIWGGSRPSSGRSTPKRISFAELPESYASSRPSSSSNKFNRKGKKREKKEDTKKAGWLEWFVGISPTDDRERDRERGGAGRWGTRELL